MTFKGKGLTPEQLERAKCPKSKKTGAHHWILPGTGRIVKERGMGRCKYCGEKRRFAMSWPISASTPATPASTDTTIQSRARRSYEMSRRSTAVSDSREPITRSQSGPER